MLIMRPDKKREQHDADPSQPEVLHDKDSQFDPNELPSQAEGDRETIEKDLEEQA